MSAIVSNLPAGVVRADEGERHDLSDLRVIYKSLGAETGGGAFVWQMQAPPGAAVPPHRHTVEDELIYVLAGAVEATVGDQTYALGAGDLVKMPKGVPHALRMTGTETARTLWMAVPAGKMESFFRALAALPSDGPPDPELIARISREHGMDVLPSTVHT